MHEQVCMKADSKMLCASSMSMCVMFLSRMQTNRRKLVDVNLGGKSEKVSLTEETEKQDCFSVCKKSVFVQRDDVFEEKMKLNLNLCSQRSELLCGKYIFR